MASITCQQARAVLFWRQQTMEGTAECNPEVDFGRRAGLKAALGLAATAPFGSVARAQSAQTVRFIVAEYSNATGPYFQKMAQEFHQANPDITVNIEVVNWNSLLQKLQTDISGGTNADLSIIGTRWLLDFVKDGVAEPLDSYMNQAFRDRFVPVFLQPGTGRRQGLWPADRRLGPRDVLQQGYADQGGLPRWPGHVGRRRCRGAEDQGSQRVRLRHARQGSRNRRLLVLCALELWRRPDRQGRQGGLRRP